MRIVLFLDQLQAGLGGKTDKQVPLGIEKGGIGSYGMFSAHLPAINGQVICTIYCGSDYFNEHETEVTTKIIKMLEKVKADVLLCAPCFDFEDYANMSAKLGVCVQSETNVKVVMACAKENEQVVETYKKQLPIVEMPKKGGVGLNDSLKQMLKVVDAVYNNQSLDEFSDVLF